MPTKTLSTKRRARQTTAPTVSLSWGELRAQATRPGGEPQNGSGPTDPILKFCAQTFEAFQYAVAIAKMSRTGGGSCVDFIMRQVAMEAAAPTCPRSIADLESQQRDVWEHWSPAEHGATFGPAGDDSALRVAAQFVDIILHATGRPKGCDALQVFPFDDPRVSNWHRTACVAVCKAIPDNWNELTIQADANALLARMRHEWKRATSPEQTGTGGGWQSSIAVDIDNDVCTANGVAYPLTHNQAIVLNALVGAAGGWVPGKNIDASNRVGRIVKGLPDPIRQMIESKSGAGFRLLA